MYSDGAHGVVQWLTVKRLTYLHSVEFIANVWSIRPSSHLPHYRDIVLRDGRGHWSRDVIGRGGACADHRRRTFRTTAVCKRHVKFLRRQGVFFFSQTSPHLTPSRLTSFHLSEKLLSLRWLRPIRTAIGLLDGDLSRHVTRSLLDWL